MLSCLRIICSMILFAFLALVGADSADATTVRVGYAEGYGLSTGPDGKTLSGYTHQYLKELARYTGWKYEFVQCPWSDCLDMLQKGEIDLFGPVQKSPERLEIMNYPSELQGYEYGALYGLSSNNRFYYNDFSGFDGMRVAVVYSNFFTKLFEEFRQKNNFTVRYVFVSDAQDLVPTLESGMADAFISGNMIETPAVKVLAKFAITPFYYAVSRKSPEALVRFNEALSVLRTEQVYLDAKLYNQFYGDSISSQPAFTRAEIDFIRTAPTFTVTMDPDWPPLEYMGSSGGYHGILPDVLRLLERGSGLRFRFVQSPSYKQALERFQRKDVDIVTLRQHKDSASSAQVTKPLLNIPVMLISRVDTPADGPTTMGMLRDAPYDMEVATHYTDFDIVHYADTPEGLQHLRSGKTKVMLVNSYVFDDLVRDPANRDLRLLAATRFTIPIRLGVNADTDILLSVLDKTITRLNQEDVNSAIFANTLIPPRPHSLLQVVKDNPMGILAGILLLVIIIFGAVLSNKHRVEGMLTQVAFTDSKTGIGNWNCMERVTPDLRGAGMCFVTMDVNNFKLLNDYFGYEVGDRALRYIASELRDNLRPGELAVRVESDVFCLLLKTGSEDEVRDRLNILASTLVNFRPMEGVTGFTMSLSFGMCMSSSEGLTVHILRDRANVARKLFKNAYRTTFAFYDDEIHTHIMQEREIENKMEDALAHGEFQPYFQPKYDLRNDSIVGAEALVRWLPPDQATIYPCHFIPLFERNGFIVKLDMFILESVCRHMREWMDLGLAVVPVSVNISKLHVLNPDFVSDVIRVIDKYGIPSSMIELELTETAFLENTELLLRIMNEFAAKGFTLSMDDFGTGYSSLNMLQEIPVHVLKLDRAFLDMSNDSTRAKNIIAHVVHMAKDLNMQVVSEGVETVDHVRFLKHVGCDMAQGFFYSPPIPAKAFSEMAFSRPLSSSFLPNA